MSFRLAWSWYLVACHFNSKIIKTRSKCIFIWGFLFGAFRIIILYSFLTTITMMSKYLVTVLSFCTRFPHTRINLFSCYYHWFFVQHSISNHLDRETNWTWVLLSLAFLLICILLLWWFYLIKKSQSLELAEMTVYRHEKCS